MNTGKHVSIKCTLMRGGTSKGVYILEKELPQDPKLREKIILSIYGSPDLRQIDGLGGANPSMSKVAIIGPPTRPDADIDYTHGQVSISSPSIDFKPNCGNISAGVGPFAIDQGLVKAVEPVTTVKIHNTNTKKIIIASVPIKDGEVVETGDYAIAGVPGTGAKIGLDFRESAGGATGSLLPTGNRRDEINLEGIGALSVSIVDFANPVVFVHAKDLGLSGTEAPAMVDNDPTMLAKLGSIRRLAAEMGGFVKHRENADKESPILPFIAFVSQPADYKNYLTEKHISENSMDLVARAMHVKENLEMHHTYPITISVCTGVAAMIPGTVVHEVTRETCRQAETVRIGHPLGAISVEVGVVEADDRLLVKKAVLGRTARKIMEGVAYVKENL
jgi:2-methylaconitate cis-trans-isomerase PrpF